MSSNENSLIVIPNFSSLFDHFIEITLCNTIISFRFFYILGFLFTNNKLSCQFCICIQNLVNKEFQLFEFRYVDFKDVDKVRLFLKSLTDSQSERSTSNLFNFSSKSNFSASRIFLSIEFFQLLYFLFFFCRCKTFPYNTCLEKLPQFVNFHSESGTNFSNGSRQKSSTRRRPRHLTQVVRKSLKLPTPDSIPQN